MRCKITVSVVGSSNRSIHQHRQASSDAEDNRSHTLSESRLCDTSDNIEWSVVQHHNRLVQAELLTRPAKTRSCSAIALGVNDCDHLVCEVQPPNAMFLQEGQALVSQLL